MTIQDDAALASAQKREAASVPQDEVEAVCIEANVQDYDFVAYVLAAADAYRKRHAKPKGWMHSATGTLHETEAEVHLADGDERAVPLYTHAAPAPQIPDGWVLVPKEPTDAMCEAAWESDATDYVGEHKRIHRADLAYKAMLAAAPKPGDDHGE